MRREVMNDQEVGPVSRDELEKRLWEILEWRGSAEKMDQLLGLIDDYALRRSVETYVTASERMRLDAEAFQDDDDLDEIDEEARNRVRRGVARLNEVVVNANDHEDPRDVKVMASQLRGLYDLIREGRLPVTGWKRIAELTEVLESKEAAAPFWRHVRGEPEGPDENRCRCCRVSLPRERWYHKDRLHSYRNTCKRCENARDRAAKRRKLET